jgi:protein O-GlcNAc transferase
VGTAPRHRLWAIGIAWLLVSGAALHAQDSLRAKDAYDRAVQLDAKGDYTGALTLLWEAAGLAPHDAEVQYRLGEALERMGALDAAADAYSRALAERPSFQKAANNLILTLVKAGRGPEALTRARALVSAAPSDPNAHFTLGLAQTDQDEAGAIESFRRVLQLAPRHMLARYNLALVLKRADRLSEAIDELGRAIAIESRPEAHYTLGVIFWHRGELDRAVASLRAAIAAEPRYADAHYTLGTILRAQRDWTGAADSLRRALALRPDLLGARYTLARVLEQSGDGAAGRAALADAERLRVRGQLEQEATVRTSVGIQHLERGDAAAAADHFRRATTIFDGYAPAHYQLGRALLRLGRSEEARAAFARARQLNPSLVPPPDAKR